MIGRSEEARLAHRIVGVLPGGDVVRVLCEDADTIRFAVNDPGSKLRSVVFSRLSLRRLLADAARDVKVEYLQRDLLTSATRRAEYRYPRVDRIVAAVRNLRKRKQSLVRAAALASVL